MAPEDLKAIAAAKKISIRVMANSFMMGSDNFTSDNSLTVTNESPWNVAYLNSLPNFLFMARAFYSGLYNDDTYLSEIKRVAEIEKAGDDLMAHPKGWKKWQLILAWIIIIIVIVYVGGSLNQAFLDWQKKQNWIQH